MQDDRFIQCGLQPVSSAWSGSFCWEEEIEVFGSISDRWRERQLIEFELGRNYRMFGLCTFYMMCLEEC